MNVRQIPMIGPAWGLISSVIIRDWADVRSFIVAVIIGISSGLPFSLIVGTLTIRMAQYGIDKSSLSVFSLTGLPYSIKFALAPIVDNMDIPFLRRMGRRRSWMLVVQVALFLSIVYLGCLEPAGNLLALFGAAFCVCLLAAVNDIVIDAYRTESSPDAMLGLVSSAAIIGYRIGMLLSGGLLLIMVGTLPMEDLGQRWSVAYLCAGSLVFLGFIASWLQPDRSIAKTDVKSFQLKSFMRRIIVEPFKDFQQNRSWLFILLFIATYRMGDAFHGFLFNPFLVDIGFAIESIGFVVKTVGFLATVSGGLIGGAVFYRMGARRSLLLCGIVEVVANTTSILQAYYGANLSLLYFTVVTEDLAQGACSACLVGYISSLCKGSFSVATKYALLTSIAALARVVCPVLGSGQIAEHFGWITFFMISIALALPALCLAYFTNHINDGVIEDSVELNQQYAVNKLN